MELKDVLFLASKAFDKGWNYETLMYGDDLYEYKGEERDVILDEIWGYVDEISENGKRWFKEEYKDFKLYF